MENEILSTIDIIKRKFETLLNKFDKVIAKEEVAKLIVQFILIKNNIDYFFQIYTKEDIVKCEKKHNIDIYDRLIEIKQEVIETYSELLDTLPQTKIEAIKEPPILNTDNEELNQLSNDVYYFLMDFYAYGILKGELNANSSLSMVEAIRRKIQKIKLKYSNKIISMYSEKTGLDLEDTFDFIMNYKTEYQEFEEKTNNVVKYIAIYLVIVAVIMLFIAFFQD